MKRFLLVCTLALIFFVFLSSCASADYGAPVAAPAPPASDMAMAEPAPAPVPVPAPSAPGASDSDGNAGVLPILTPSESGGRRLAYTVEMQLQTTDFMAGTKRLRNTIGEMDGFLINAIVHGRDMRTPEVERSASYVFRLPAENLPRFIVLMEDNYNLLYLWQASDDVTVNYAHGSVTLGDLREQEERLRNELDKENLTVSQRQNLERELADLLTSIRSIEAQQSIRDDNVLFSTITVSIFEVVFVEIIEEEELTFGERFINAITRSWDGFLAFCQGFVIFLIRALPTLLILGVIALITIVIVRKCTKKSREKRKQQQAAGPVGYPGYPNWNGNVNQYYNNQSVASTPNVAVDPNVAHDPNTPDTDSNTDDADVPEKNDGE